jgi:lysozyme
MTPSEQCIDLIKRFEGYSATAYPDPGTGGAPWTIGYGHTRGVKQGDTTDMDQATRWIYDDVQDAADAVQRGVAVPLSQNQYDALVSFVYNVGAGNFFKSTLIKLLNAGDWDGAAREFVRWNRAGGHEMAGLTRRREAEAALFRGEG